MLGIQTRLAPIVSSPEWQTWVSNLAALKSYSARYGDVADWDPSGGKINSDGPPARQRNVLKLLDQAFYTGDRASAPSRLEVASQSKRKSQYGNDAHHDSNHSRHRKQDDRNDHDERGRNRVLRRTASHLAFAR